MGNVILCQIPRAVNPWYLENTGLNIYSVEELGYFICNNLPLVDDTVFCEGLALWMKKEMQMSRFPQKLVQMLNGPYTIFDIAASFLKEIHYLSPKELSAMELQMRDLENKPEAVRIKKKADTLLLHNKINRALKAYQSALVCDSHGNMGTQFRGTIYNNMGCAYAKLFMMEEACDCFRLAYEDLHTLSVLKSYLFSIYMKDGEEVYRRKLDEFGVDEKSRRKLAEEISQIKVPDAPENLEEALADWTGTYHKNTDM